MLRRVLGQAGFEALAAQLGGFEGAALVHEGLFELADALLQREADARADGLLFLAFGLELGKIRDVLLRAVLAIGESGVRD